MLRIGVIGQSGAVSAEVYALAEEVGREIAARGAILLTGGTNGVMEAVSKGAKTAGGLVVGILPGDKVDGANRYVDIPITTGLSFDYRSLILVHSSDAIIMIGGENGTLGELSTAYLNCKPIVVIEPSGGWAARIRGAVYDGLYMDTRRSVKLDFAHSAAEALDIIVDRVGACPEQDAGTNPDGNA
ncbi:MAG: TIGR00725 family protein [Negativicutes bacterium]|nr:TIGR00725 family protein [Negativicutes bacterium]